jgi:predicted methyltransferase
MHPRIVPLLSLSALLLTVACDEPEAKKPDAKAEAKKADVKADAKQAPDGKKEGAMATGNAKPADEAAAKAKEEEERKARLAKAFAELEQWKAAEKTRWTAEVEADAKRLAETDWADASTALAAVVAGKHRLPKNVERDPFRHPTETLTFMGLRPDMTVIEIQPGWGWYTELLAPVLAKQGKLLVTDGDPTGPEDKGSTLYARRFAAFMERSPAAYGKIERLVQADGKPLALGPDGSADMVLVFRAMHGWVDRGTFDDDVKAIHAVLEPGGILGVEQHRAKDDAKPEQSAKDGYLPQPWLVGRLEAAGFQLEEASELNANPKDTKDHPEGVWTLPPSLALGQTDKAKYEAIGESDRMTLRLRKK